MQTFASSLSPCSCLTVKAFQSDQGKKEIKTAYAAGKRRIELFGSNTKYYLNIWQFDLIIWQTWLLIFSLYIVEHSWYFLIHALTQGHTQVHAHTTKSHSVGTWYHSTALRHLFCRNCQTQAERETERGGGEWEAVRRRDKQQPGHLWGTNSACVF